MNYETFKPPKVLHSINFELGYGEVTTSRYAGEVRLWVFVHSQLVWTQRCRSIYETDAIIRRMYRMEVNRAA